MKHYYRSIRAKQLKLNGTFSMLLKQPHFSFRVQPAAYTQRSLQRINKQRAHHFGKHYVGGKNASISKPIHTTLNTGI